MKIINELLYPVQEQNGMDYYWGLNRFVELEDGTFFKVGARDTYTAISNDKRDMMVANNWTNYNEYISK